MARILITDDAPAARRAIALALRRQGFRVIAAPGRGPALDAVEAFAFDLMIVDVPAGSDAALEAIRTLRRNAPDVPIIATTSVARGAGDLDRDAARLGIACTLREPFTPLELLAAIKACLGRRHEDRVPQ
jgi:DNA-binding response OmpR family regulator